MGKENQSKVGIIDQANCDLQPYYYSPLSVLLRLSNLGNWKGPSPPQTQTHTHTHTDVRIDRMIGWNPLLQYLNNRQSVAPIYSHRPAAWPTPRHQPQRLCLRVAAAAVAAVATWKSHDLWRSHRSLSTLLLLSYFFNICIYFPIVTVPSLAELEQVWEEKREREANRFTTDP